MLRTVGQFAAVQYQNQLRSKLKILCELFRVVDISGFGLLCGLLMKNLQLIITALCFTLKNSTF